MRHAEQKQLIMGTITAPHGVRGLFKVKFFCDRAEDLTAYGPLYLEDGSQLDLVFKGQSKGLAVCAASGISDRNAVDVLKGQHLLIARDNLPDPHGDEIYHADLLGMQVINPKGKPYGTVIAIHNFGAGDILEVQIEAAQKTELLPFYAPFLTGIDEAAGQIILDIQSDDDTKDLGNK